MNKIMKILVITWVGRQISVIMVGRWNSTNITKIRVSLYIISAYPWIVVEYSGIEPRLGRNSKNRRLIPD